MASGIVYFLIYSVYFENGTQIYYLANYGQEVFANCKLWTFVKSLACDTANEHALTYTAHADSTKTAQRGPSLVGREPAMH